MPWSAVVGLVGGMMSSDAAGDAAAAGAAGQNSAAQLNYAATQQARTDSLPWLNSGSAALNELDYRMGIGNGGVAPGAAAFVPKSEQQFRNELLDQYTSGTAFEGGYYDPMNGAWTGAKGIRQGTVDEVGLNAAVQKALASQTQYQTQLEAAKTAADLARANDPNYGSLMDPFTLKDFKKDPGYNFRLQEGRKGIDAMAAARGGYNSGATLKALSRYNQDYATGEFQNAWNRDNANDTNIYNRLAGIAGTGQTAANTLGNQAIMGSQYQGNAMASAGEWRGAGAIGQNNAMQGALGSAYGALKGANFGGGGGYDHGGDSSYGSMGGYTPTTAYNGLEYTGANAIF